MVLFLSQRVVIELHDYIVSVYGGATGIRDLSLLDSAINQPKLEYLFTNADLCKVAAAYGFHISENQAFVEGNKRTAHAAMTVFLRLNGLEMTATDEETIEKLLDIANKRMNKQQLAEWLQTVTRPKSK